MDLKSELVVGDVLRSTVSGDAFRVLEPVAAGRLVGNPFVRARDLKRSAKLEREIDTSIDVSSMTLDPRPQQAEPDPDPARANSRKGKRS